MYAGVHNIQSKVPLWYCITAVVPKIKSRNMFYAILNGTRTFTIIEDFTPCSVNVSWIVHHHHPPPPNRIGNIACTYVFYLSIYFIIISRIRSKRMYTAKFKYLQMSGKQQPNILPFILWCSILVNLLNAYIDTEKILKYRFSIIE